MRYILILLSLLLGPALPAHAQVSIGIGTPNLSIGINLPGYPEFARVPGYPVYYAPQVGYNLFFYDGLYWAYYGDNWYASSWYNGPWGFVSPMYVPAYVLRVPVRYYRAPPPYFRGWPHDAPPRWGQYYGQHWEKERHGWDSWNHKYVPAPAPLPAYQREYSGDRYPHVNQQPMYRSEYYHYQPSEPVARQYYEQETVRYGQHSQKESKQGKGQGNDKGHGNGQGHDD
jgi:hypothetical protein